MLIASTGLMTAQEDVTECPYFSVTTENPEELQFSLLSTNVDATISGVIANVVVEQTYFNAGDSPLDATYVFPMSSQAAVYAMEMVVGDRTIVAEIRRKDEAQEIFNEANEAGVTASLLEQNRPNVFQMSLANIAPGESIQVLMTYTELLVPNDGVYQFVFPNIVGPRYTTSNEPWVVQSIENAVPLAQTDLNILLKINAGMPLQAECSSHQATFDYQSNSARTTVATNPGSDFIVNYTLDGDQIETGLLLYEGEEENFFLSMIQPARPDLPFESPPREYIFIMDVSGSMNGMPLDLSQQLMQNLLDGMNTEDKFNIIYFAGSSAALAENSLEVNPENIMLAQNMTNGQNSGGSTNLLPAMQRALNMEGTEGFSRTFVILTDGQVTVETAAFQLIRDNLDEANFFAFGIGNSVNRYIIEGLAYVGEGKSFVATYGDDVDEIAEQFERYIERPVLTNIEADFEGIEVYDIEPLTIPDVFAQRPIIVFGKYEEPADGTISIYGDYGDGHVAASLDFADYAEDTEENIALKYLWARKKIKLMSDYGIGSNEQDEISIEEEITQLGLDYSLVTAFTSFVAVDSSALANQTEEAGNNPDDGVFVSNDDLLASSIADASLFRVVGAVTEVEPLLRLKLNDPDNLATEQLTIQITDINGRLIETIRVQSDQIKEILELDLGPLSAGIYFVSFVSEQQILASEKFMIKR